ncbi:MAG: RNA recognition motif domain-containing protein [Phycisphaerales bacterium]
MKKLYVGNLPFRSTEDELRDLFGQHGEVSSASIVMDRETGRSRGFAFVEMSDDGDAETAINALNGYSLGGRALVVNEARPREERPVAAAAVVTAAVAAVVATAAVAVAAVVVTAAVAAVAIAAATAAAVVAAAADATGNPVRASRAPT